MIRSLVLILVITSSAFGQQVQRIRRTYPSPEVCSAVAQYAPPVTGEFFASIGLEYQEFARPGVVFSGGYERGRAGWMVELGLATELTHFDEFSSVLIPGTRTETTTTVTTREETTLEDGKKGKGHRNHFGTVSSETTTTTTTVTETDPSVVTNSRHGDERLTRERLLTGPSIRVFTRGNVSGRCYGLVGTVWSDKARLATRTGCDVRWMNGDNGVEVGVSYLYFEPRVHIPAVSARWVVTF